MEFNLEKDFNNNLRNNIWNNLWMYLWKNGFVIRFEDYLFNDYRDYLLNDHNNTSIEEILWNLT